MGETGVPGIIDQVQTAQVITPVAQPEQPAPVAQAEPAPAPVQEQQQMGAAPAPEPAPQMVARADRG